MTHLSEHTLKELLTAAAGQVTVGATYMHYKQKPYVVLDLAILEATNELCVVYQAQYGQRLVFVRPLSSWLETVPHSGKAAPRFLKINERQA